MSTTCEQRLEQKTKIISAKLETALRERYYIVFKCNMYIVITGSGGNLYHIAIDLRPTCSCPDFKKYKTRWLVCKHILFLFVKLAGLEIENLVTGVVPREIFPRVQNFFKECDITAPKDVIAVYMKIKTNCCDICSGVREMKGNIYICSTFHHSCKSVFHMSCIQKWAYEKHNHCPTCRQEWSFHDLLSLPYLNVKSLIEN